MTIPNLGSLDPGTYVSPLFDGMFWYAWHVISWFFSSTFWQRCWLLITNPQREIRRNIFPPKMLGLPWTNFWHNFAVTKFWRGGGIPKSHPLLVSSEKTSSQQKATCPSTAPQPLRRPKCLSEICSQRAPIFVDKRLPTLNFFVAPEKWGDGLLSNWAGNFSGALLNFRG